MKLLKLLAVVLSVMFFSTANAGDKVKVGFIYVGLQAIMDGLTDTISEDKMCRSILETK